MSWNEFRAKNKGSGKTMQQLSTEYRSLKAQRGGWPGDPPSILKKHHEKKVANVKRLLAIIDGSDPKIYTKKELAGEEFVGVKEWGGNTRSSPDTDCDKEAAWIEEIQQMAEIANLHKAIDKVTRREPGWEEVEKILYDPYGIAFKHTNIPRYKPTTYPERKYAFDGPYSDPKPIVVKPFPMYEDPSKNSDANFVPAWAKGEKRPAVYTRNNGTHAKRWDYMDKLRWPA